MKRHHRPVKRYSPAQLLEGGCFSKVSVFPSIEHGPSWSKFHVRDDGIRISHDNSGILGKDANHGRDLLWKPNVVEVTQKDEVTCDQTNGAFKITAAA